MGIGNECGNKMCPKRGPVILAGDMENVSCKFFSWQNMSLEKTSKFSQFCRPVQSTVSDDVWELEKSGVSFFVRCCAGPRIWLL